MSSNASTPSTSPDQTKLTVPSANALEGSGNLSRTSTISTQSDVSPCPSLFDKPDDEVSSGNVTENDTPPESPGRTSTKVHTASSTPVQDDQAPDIAVSTVDSPQQAKEAVTGNRKSRSGRRIMRSVSVVFMQLAKVSYISSSRMLKRTGPPSSLELPSTHQPGYGTPPARPQELERNLSVIVEVSRENSQASQPPSECPDGLPSTSGTAWDISIRVTPPASSQQPMTCPSAPLIRPAQLPKDTMDEMACDDDISPLNLHSPMHIFRGNLVGRSATRASTVDTYNPYFPPIDGQVQSLL